MGNIGSHAPMNSQEALDLGSKWLGPGYKEIGPKGSGVFQSADGTRQFRMTDADILGAHGSDGAHVHFEAMGVRGKAVENLHLPIKN
jgi:filamentous hemagglutinin